MLVMSGFLGESSTTENCNLSFLMLACEFAALLCDIFCLYSLPCMGMGSNSLNSHHKTHTHIRWIRVCQSIAVLGATSLLRWNTSPSNFHSNSTKHKKFCPLISFFLFHRGQPRIQFFNILNFTLLLKVSWSHLVT